MSIRQKLQQISTSNISDVEKVKRIAHEIILYVTNLGGFVSRIDFWQDTPEIEIQFDNINIPTAELRNLQFIHIDTDENKITIMPLF